MRIYPDVALLPLVQTDDLWVLTHADLKATGRVRKLLDHTYERLAIVRGSLEGSLISVDEE